jgi:uncharacterized protein DUF3800
MPFTIFADESGTSAVEPCYVIGALTIPDEDLSRFLGWFGGAIRNHGVVGEARWAKVAKGHGLINLVIDLMKEVLSSDISFSCIVVLKSAFRKWRTGGEEVAFYTTYCLLLQHVARGSNDTYAVHIDERQDSYDKQDEVVQVITNRMLNRIVSQASLRLVQKADSRLILGIQAADLLTGAVKAAHHLYLDPECPLSSGKRLALKRLSEMLGWAHLHFDTWPNHDFNIWHFPSQEYRAVPATMMVRPNVQVQYIVPTDFDTSGSGRA